MEERYILRIPKKQCDCDDCHFFRSQKEGFYIKYDKYNEYNVYLVSLDGERTSSSMYNIETDLIKIYKNKFDIELDKLFEL